MTRHTPVSSKSIHHLIILSLVMFMGACGGSSGGGDNTERADDADDALINDDNANADAQDSGSADDIDVSPQPQAPQCEVYCEAFTEACSDTIYAYQDQDACLVFCESIGALNPGAEGDSGVNSVGCRLSALSANRDGETADSCAAASRFGGGLCGSLCDNYCHLSEVQCGADHVTGDLQRCLSVCEAVPVGELSDTGLDSLYCRLNALASLTPEPPMGPLTTEARCLAAGEAPGSLCVAPPTCEAFCGVATATCQDDLAQFADEATCKLTCLDYISLPSGQNSDWLSNTLACRFNHATEAERSGNPELYCPAVGVSGGGRCGALCDVYCDLAASSCPGDDALYADREGCLAACSVMDDTGGTSDTNGDTIQCRINQLVLAGVDGLSRAERCAEAGQISPNDCRNSVPTCEAYCAAIMGSCGAGTHPLAQFTDKQSCLNYCDADDVFITGTTDDANVNSLGCRINQALSALNEATTLCPAAGPSGGGICGDWCDVLCQLEALYCDGELSAFPDTESCITACGGWDDGGASGDTLGDTVQCKLEQLVSVTRDGHSPTAACGELTSDGGETCTGMPPEPESPCSLYCGAVTAACTGANAQYPDEAACLAYCEQEAALPIGQPSTAGNSTLCRLDQANLALNAPEVHCPSAGPSGNNVCGTWCENYCYLADLNCTTSPLFESGDACASSCASFATTGEPGDETGDTVQCRLTALGLAGSQGGVFQGAYCPRAGADGGGTCVD